MEKNEVLTKQEILRQGQTTQFWQLIIESLRDSKNHLRNEQDSEDLKDLPADQYKVESELIKAKIKYIDKLIEYPNTLIGWLEKPDNEQTEYDPYQ